MLTNRFVSRLITGACFAGFASSALAQEHEAMLGDLPRVGKAYQGGTSLLEAASVKAETAHALDTGLLWLCIIITLFVVALLGYVIVRYRNKGDAPKRFTHNTPLEIAWTIVPVVILVVVAAFSIPALRQQTIIPESDLTIKVTGYQWYWEYEYPEEEIGFVANMLQREDLAAYGYSDDEYLLAVDNAVVVPVGKVVRVQVTGADVIHSWKIQSFATMKDAVPGRLEETWFKADREGVYFGQCSELCGRNHAYMPIVVKVVSEEAYDEWLTATKIDQGVAVEDEPVDVASIQ